MCTTTEISHLHFKLAATAEMPAVERAVELIVMVMTTIPHNTVLQGQIIHARGTWNVYVTNLLLSRSVSHFSKLYIRSWHTGLPQHPSRACCWTRAWCVQRVDADSKAAVSLISAHRTPCRVSLLMLVDFSLSLPACLHSFALN